MKRLVVFGLVFLLTLGNLPAQAPVTFSTQTTLVIIDVEVKDKAGKTVEDLKKGDFQLTEDGKAQQIAVFDFQKLDLGAPPAPAQETKAPDAKTAETKPAETKPASVSAAVIQTPTPAASKPAPVATKPGTAQPVIRYQDKRLVAMLFDMSTMEVAEQIRVQKSALDFIHKSLKPADMVSIMTATAGPLEITQDFTDDRDSLEAAIKKFHIGEASDLSETLGAGDTSDDNTFSADQSEFDIFNVDKKFTTIETSCKLLASFPEKKALIYFSSGITQSGTDNQAELTKAVNVCKKSNVVIDTIDARGMTASAPGGDATTKSGSGSGLFTAGAAGSAGGRGGGRGGAANDSAQETLATLSADTGGKLFAESNDIAVGLEQARDDLSSYYILGYYSTNSKADGKYRTVNVKLTRADVANAKLEYKHGYFADKEFGKFTEADKEDQLQQALILGDPITDLTLAAEVNYFRLARDRYFVPLNVKIPGSEIALAKSKGNAKTSLDFIGQLRTPKDQIAAQVADGITIQLQEQSLSQLNSGTIAYDTGFAVPPGSYKLKFLMRENETGKMGTYEQTVNIPDLAADQQARIKTSSLVLSSQRQPLNESLATAERDKKIIAQNPLVQENNKLVPSVTRVFKKDQDMFVFLEAYQPDAATAQPLVATVSFYRGKVKAFETAPLQVTDGLNAKSKALPIRFSVPLGKLQTGRYTCQVSVLDPQAQKFAFWRGPIVMVP